jgi:adenine-specific DNA-methyltransferase
VNRESADVLAERIAELEQTFPEAVTEGKVDFDKLRATLGEEVDGRAERYSFSWAGKRDCIRLLQTPSRATLIPAQEESVDFDTTQNLFIEGDNLEVLKLLYKSYFGRVKMIYIDPPYNIGTDKIYEDDYSDSLAPYLRLTGQADDAGNVLTSNPETSGRYHSAWLSMMYPRLFIARQLLSQYGAIFVSIDDNEVHDLRMVMNEVFGEENFVACLVWVGGRRNDSHQVSTSHEYIVCYARSLQDITQAQIEWRERKDGIDRIYAVYERLAKQRKHDWMAVSEGLQEWCRGLKPYDPAKEHEHYRWADARGVYFASDMSGPDDGRKSRPRYEVIHPQTKKPVPIPARGWRWEKSTMDKALSEDRVHFGPDEGGIPNIKVYLRENEYQVPSSVFYKDRRAASAALRDLLQAKVFDFPKDHEVLRRLVSLLVGPGETVMDFFGGTSSTAHAVLDLNHADFKGRRFVMVQLPETTEPDSHAGLAGYQTIAAIGKERIRRVIAKLKKESQPKLALEDGDQEDLGFKVFKLTASNYRQFEEKPAGETDSKKYAKQMAMFRDALVEGWKPENVIYEVAIKEGFGLNCRIEEADRQGAKKKQAGPKVYRVIDPDKEQSFYICLDDEIRLESLRFLSLKKDDLFICRDKALDDEAAANLALQCRLKTI